MIRCPHCNLPMKEVSARANPGTLIVLDQCGGCGGIWCDKWELFPVDPDEASRLDPVDEGLLCKPVQIEKTPLYCPRCTGRLETFREPLLPPDLRLERCPRCEGIWLNRGEFSRFKRFQKKSRVERMDKEEWVKKLARSYSDPKSWVTVGTGGMFAYPRASPGDEEPFASTLSGAVSLILQALLRLVLRF